MIHEHEKERATLTGRAPRVTRTALAGCRRLYLHSGQQPLPVSFVAAAPPLWQTAQKP